jgi:LPXTG-site transpeptidase (sortase) family protein
MQRRTIGVLILLASIALIALAGFSLLRDEASSGDVAAVEDALRPEIPTPVELGPPPTTTATAPERQGDTDEAATAEPEMGSIADPVGLQIDKLDVDAPIDAYGVDERTGEMAVPDNATDVAWYKFGPSPGDAGSAVLAAHVDLASSGPGVFFELQTLNEGDRIVVSYEDGSEMRFRVVARVTYEKDELPLDVIFSRQGPPVLTLITCGGGFNSNIARYDSNVVVYAVPDTGENAIPGDRL